MFNRSVLLNITYFHQTFEDFQLNTFLGTAFVVESIPELKSQGFDADFVVWDPTASAVIEPAKIEHKNKITPYAGNLTKWFVAVLTSARHK